MKKPWRSEITPAQQPGNNSIVSLRNASSSSHRTKYIDLRWGAPDENGRVIGVLLLGGKKGGEKRRRRDGEEKNRTD
jgi:hypothetical protein